MATMYSVAAADRSPYITFVVVNYTALPKMIPFLKHPVRLDAFSPANEHYYHSFTLDDVDTGRRLPFDTDMKNMVAKGCTVLLISGLDAAIPG
jgi:hypothetical protein